MVSFKFRGLVAPVFTIFNKDNSINVTDIPKYAKYLAQSGIKAVLVHGTTGEGMSLNVSERKLISEAWANAVKTTKQHLMIQVGGAPLPDVLELAKHAEQLGADSILCLPELYFKPTNPTELVNYFRIVCKVVPNTPVLYYHIPAWTNVTINMADFLNDTNLHKITNFCGIKFTSINLVEGMQAVQARNRHYAVFLGADQLLAGALTLGFDSAIATTLNIVPKLSIDIIKAIEAGKVEEARYLQEKLTAHCDVITKNGTWVPTMKAAMSLLTPIDVGQAREPLVNINQVQIAEMKSSLCQLSCGNN